METIGIEEFHKLDLRIARIVSAERVEGTDKLIQLTLDVGNGDAPRTCVAGIARVYQPEDLLGKQVLYLANLEPITLRGVRSEGMILASGNDNDLALLVPERPRAPGEKVL